MLRCISKAPGRNLLRLNQQFGCHGKVPIVTISGFDVGVLTGDDCADTPNRNLTPARRCRKKLPITDDVARYPIRDIVCREGKAVNAK